MQLYIETVVISLLYGYEQAGGIMWGVSLGDYIVYWIGLAIITVVAVTAGLVSFFRSKDDR